MTNADLIEKLRDIAVHFEVEADGISACSDLAKIREKVIGQAINALVDLEAKLANAERRAEDAETRNDFLLSEIDKIIKRERQKS